MVAVTEGVGVSAGAGVNVTDGVGDFAVVVVAAGPTARWVGVVVGGRVGDEVAEAVGDGEGVAVNVGVAGGQVGEAVGGNRCTGVSAGAGVVACTVGDGVGDGEPEIAARFRNPLAIAHHSSTRTSTRTTRSVAMPPPISMALRLKRRQIARLRGGTGGC